MFNNYLKKLSTFFKKITMKRLSKIVVTYNLKQFMKIHG